MPPESKTYLQHQPSSVAILGMGPSLMDFFDETLTQEYRPEFADEIWAVNMASNAAAHDVVFWMDDLEHQAALTPHSLVPTLNFRMKLAELAAAVPCLVGSAKEAQTLPDQISDEEWRKYRDGVDQFFNIGPGLDAPYRAVLAVREAIEADFRQRTPDKSRNLSGLIRALAKRGKPVITSIRRPDLVPNSFDYPISEVAKIGIPYFGRPYLNNGIAMALAYAIWKEVKIVKIYGADFSYPNRDYAESGRACVEAWLTLGLHRGMDIRLPKRTSLMDTIKDGGVYGYDEQPAVVMPGNLVYRYQRQGTATIGQYVQEARQIEPGAPPLHDPAEFEAAQQAFRAAQQDYRPEDSSGQPPKGAAP